MDKLITWIILILLLILNAKMNHKLWFHYDAYVNDRMQRPELRNEEGKIPSWGAEWRDLLQNPFVKWLTRLLGLLVLIGNAGVIALDILYTFEIF